MILHAHPDEKIQARSVFTAGDRGIVLIDAKGIAYCIAMHDSRRCIAVHRCETLEGLATR